MSKNIISWDKGFSVGHEKIDGEHKKLFDIAGEIYKFRKDSKKILVLLKELVDYTKYHFKNEEIYMESIGYDDLKRHKALHKNIIENLTNTIKEINNYTLDELFDKLSFIVSHYIVQHILIEDKKFHHKRKTREELKSHFKWRGDYKIFNDMIDREHKELFDIALKALDYHNTDIRTHIKITIQELYDYMKTHFEHEEAYMEEIAYPNIKEHKKLHEKIINQMNDFIKQLPKLNLEDFEKRLIEYMDIWLINHILYEDRKIISYKKQLQFKS